MNKNVKLLLSALQRTQNNGITYSDDTLGPEHIFNFEVYKGWPSVKLGVRQDIRGRVDRVWLYSNDADRPILDATVYPEEGVHGPYMDMTDCLSITVRSVSTLTNMAPIMHQLLTPAMELLTKHKEPVNGTPHPDTLGETEVFERFYRRLDEL